MIGMIKSFAQVERTHVDCGAISNITFCHLSHGINRIPAAQMFLKAVLVIRGLEEINLSKTAISNSSEITGLIEMPLKSSTDKALVRPSHLEICTE